MASNASPVPLFAPTANPIIDNLMQMASPANIQLLRCKQPYLQQYEHQNQHQQIKIVNAPQVFQDPKLDIIGKQIIPVHQLAHQTLHISH